MSKLSVAKDGAFVHLSVLGVVNLGYPVHPWPINKRPRTKSEVF